MRFAGLAAGWSVPVAPGTMYYAAPPGLVCSDGTPWLYTLIEPEEPVEGELFIEFMGGGGCFDKATCSGEVEGVSHIAGTGELSAVLPLLNNSNFCTGLLSAFGGYGLFTGCGSPLSGRRGAVAMYCSGDTFLGDTESRAGPSAQHSRTRDASRPWFESFAQVRLRWHEGEPHGRRARRAPAPGAQEGLPRHEDHLRRRRQRGRLRGVGLGRARRAALARRSGAGLVGQRAARAVRLAALEGQTAQQGGDVGLRG